MWNRIIIVYYCFVCNAFCKRFVFGTRCLDNLEPRKGASQLQLASLWAKPSRSRLQMLSRCNHSFWLLWCDSYDSFVVCMERLCVLDFAGVVGLWCRHQCVSEHCFGVPTSEFPVAVETFKPPPLKRTWTCDMNRKVAVLRETSNKTS